MAKLGAKYPKLRLFVPYEEFVAFMKAGAEPFLMTALQT